jgi:transposase
MLSIPGNARLFICQHPVNMRKSFEGLSALVEELFPEELLSGALFIFLNRRKDHMKVFLWDKDGLVIWFKRLEKGSFASKNISHAA